MKFLVDAALPATLAAEAPVGIVFERWEEPAVQDSDLIHYAAHHGLSGVIFCDRNSLKQPGLRQLAEELGIALVAIDASDPIQARDRLLRHIERIRSALTETKCVLVLSSEVRSLEPPSLSDTARSKSRARPG